MSRNGIGIYRHRGADQWVFKYRDPQTGKWRQKSTGTDSKREAWAIKTMFLEDLEAGRLPTEMSTWTLKDAADHWLEYRRATKAPKTAATEKRFLRQVIKVYVRGEF